MHHKGYKVRLFPNKQQEEMFWKHIHACRFIWNLSIELNLDNHNKTGKFYNRYDCSKIITYLKQNPEYEWLNEVSAHSLAKVSENVFTSYSRYLHRKGCCPKFKSKKSAKNSFPIRDYKNATYFANDHYIQIPKCGRVKCKFDYRKENIDLKSIHLLSPTITFTANRKWILSFALECENQTFYEPKNGPLGIDVGIKEAFVYSYRDLNGEVNTEIVHNINKSKKLKDVDEKIKKAHQSISRKIRVAKIENRDYNKSKRYINTLIKLKKLSYKRSNIIRDEYEKITTHIIKDIRPSIIWLEDLDLTIMMRKGRLNKYIQQCNWGLFRRLLEKKGELFCIPVLYANKNFASTQTCSHCGERKKLSLGDRIYHCDYCGMTIDRDVNASINLMNYQDYRNENGLFLLLDQHV